MDGFVAKACAGLVVMGGCCIGGVAHGGTWSVQLIGAVQGKAFLNNRGQVAGNYINQGGFSTGFVTAPDGQNRTDLVPLGGYSTRVLDFNDAGQLLAVTNTDWADSVTSVAYATANTLDSTDLQYMRPAFDLKSSEGRLNRFGRVFGWEPNPSTGRQAYFTGNINGGSMTAVVGVAPSQPGTMSLPADGRMFSPQIYAQNSRINFTLPDLSTDSVAGPTMKKGDSAYMTLANDMGQLVATSFKLAAALSPPYGRWQQTTFSGGRLSNFGEHLNPWVATTWAGDRGQDLFADLILSAQPGIAESPLAGKMWRLETWNDRGQMLVSFWEEWRYDGPNDMYLVTPPQAECEVTYTVLKETAEQFSASVSINNLGSQDLHAWKVGLYFDQSVSVSRRDNANIRVNPRAGLVMAQPTPFNGVIEPMGTVTMTFTGTKSAALPALTNLVGRVDAGLCASSM